MQEIMIRNREKDQLERELVYGEGCLRWLYASSTGRCLQPIVTRKWFSRCFGKWQDSPLSRRKIPLFIKDFHIDMTEYLPTSEAAMPEAAYPNFNAFFSRQFLPGKRPFVQQPDYLAAPAEGRYMAYASLENNANIVIKSHRLDKKRLLGDDKWLETLNGGPALIIRLCPTDYHRYHFPDSGEILDLQRKSGLLHSVGHLPMRLRDDVLFTNERVISILKSDHFGTMAYIEIGAICVGKMVATHDGSSAFKRGEEKGYFLFGGSTIVILGEKDKWQIDSDILETSAAGYETLIKVGSKIGQRSAEIRSH